MAQNQSPAPNIIAHVHRLLLETYVEKHAPSEEGPDLDVLTKRAQKKLTDTELPVCIIGAGLAGLYTAMIFESLGIKYQIIEAKEEARLGGRLITHKFPNGGKNDYVDYGGMRFPDTILWGRFFHLVREKFELKLVPFILELFEPPHTWLYFNGKRVNNHAEGSDGGGEDPFGLSGYVTKADLRTQAGVENKLRSVVQPFRNMFRPREDGTVPDIQVALKEVFKATNQDSTRTWMFRTAGMDPKDVSWCETLTDSAGTFNLAFTAYIIDSLVWDWPSTPGDGPENPKENPNEGWYSIDGGAGTLPWAMFNSLSADAQANALFNSPVTAISCATGTDGGGEGQDKDGDFMKISIRGENTPREYSAVISTIPLPSLHFIDLSGAKINEKVGMKFKRAWWRELAKPIYGGRSYTDLVIRTIAYPAYPENATTATASKVLIVTFLKLKDSERVTAQINPDGTPKPGLLDVIFRDLAAVHGVKEDDLRKDYDDKPENFFSWDWAQDPFGAGFAFFGPGVYGDGDTFFALLEPAADNKLFLAGEATSPIHATAGGSLNSAWRAVWQYLKIYYPGKLDDFYEKWGKTEYWDGKPPETKKSSKRKKRRVGGGQVPHGDRDEEEEEDETPAEDEKRIPSEGEDPDDPVNWYDDLMKKHLKFALGG